MVVSAGPDGDSAMPSDEAARTAGRPEAIKNPEQLQQAKRPDVPVSSKPLQAVGERSNLATPPRAGILGQLDTERAHD